MSGKTTHGHCDIIITDFSNIELGSANGTYLKITKTMDNIL